MTASVPTISTIYSATATAADLTTPVFNAAAAGLTSNAIVKLGKNECYEILLGTLLNNSENVRKIESAFATKPGAVKICVSTTYNITLPDQDHLTEYNIWTNFNIAGSLSGKFLFFYASSNWNILGTEWNGACDLKSSNNPVLDIDISSLPALISSDEVKWSLLKVTQLVSACMHSYRK